MVEEASKIVQVKGLDGRALYRGTVERLIEGDNSKIGEGVIWRRR